MLESELLECLKWALEYYASRAESPVIEDGELRLYWDGEPAVVHVGEGRPDWKPDWSKQ